MNRITVICTNCNAKAEVWKSPEEIAQMEYSEVDNAYRHICAKCKYQSVDDDAPMNMPHSSDPERTLHAQRTSGAYHTNKWLTTPLEKIERDTLNALRKAMTS